MYFYFDIHLNNKNIIYSRFLASFINLNGKILPAENTIPAHDNRAFRYGYGLFETMLCIDGQIQLLQYHWDRLFAGMEQLQFNIPATFNSLKLEEAILNTIQKNKLEKLCRIRLQVYPGHGGLYDNNRALQYIIECFPLENAAITLNENGLVMGIAEGLQKSSDTLANLKTASGLIYAMAAQKAIAEKWNDALIYNTSGNIIESTIANIFWVKDNIIYTPPLSEGCVAGVMRRHIIATLAANNIRVHERSLSKELIIDADEVFLTNAIKGIRWVKQFDEKTFTTNQTARMVYQLVCHDTL